MQFEKGKSELPTGKGRELNEAKETLPAIGVKHEVVWVNPDLDIPFDLEVGKPTNLAQFLTDQTEDKEGIKKREVETYHNRSALLARIIFSEKRKRENRRTRQLFRDIDIKGLGYVKYMWSNVEQAEYGPDYYTDSIKVRKHLNRSSDATGILDLGDAKKDALLAEQFTQYGIRTHRVIAVVKLEEIVLNGKIISIDEGKDQRVLEDHMTPALEIRAFGTHARLIDLIGEDKAKSRVKTLLEDARKLVVQELGKNPTEFSIREYAFWLAETIGRNLGLMHKNGFVHGYLSQGHNITLDGSFVDFDSIKNSEDSEEFILEFDSLGNTLFAFFGRILHETDSGSIEFDSITAFTKFRSSYHDTLEG